MEFYGGYPVYSESGIDLTLLRENLKRSVKERWQENSRALKLVEKLRPAACASRLAPDERRPRMAELNAHGLLGELVRHRVEFVLIGGLAMIVHGSAHVTRDLNVCYKRSKENIAALAAAQPLHPYLRGAPPGLPFKWDAATIEAGLNFILVTDYGDVDFLGEVSGIGSYEQVRAQSDEENIEGLTIRVLSLDGLIVAKKAAGRAKDLAQLLELEELKKLRDANG
jgi:hypothetical protein